jgi:uncharacterized protein with HEPN domain
MRGERGDKVRLQHILEAIREIENYIVGVNYSDFSQNSMMRFATVKQIEIIGEATNHISNDTKEKYPEVRWRQIVGLRNILVHEYFSVDSAIIWDIVENDLPKFKEHIILIMEKYTS